MTSNFREPGEFGEGATMTDEPRKKTMSDKTDPKHISQLDPVARARADQATRDALLAIVAAQPLPLRILIDQLDEIAASHRLIIESDGEAITMRVEKADLIIASQTAKLIN